MSAQRLARHAAPTKSISEADGIPWHVYYLLSAPDTIPLRVENLAGVVAPPYDVISPEMQERSIGEAPSTSSA